MTHQIKRKSNVDFVYVTLFGGPLVPDLEHSIEEIVNRKYAIPAKVEFNSSWKINHLCGNCHEQVSFGEHYGRTREFEFIEELNSINYSLDFLKNLTSLFSGLKLGVVNGESYINRTDFHYEYDMQRMTSVEPVLYNCANCKTEYLANIRIGLPLYPEKNMPFGMLGAICIDEILQIAVEGNKRFAEVAEENKVRAS